MGTYKSFSLTGKPARTGQAFLNRRPPRDTKSVMAACNLNPGSFNQPARDSRLRIQRGDYSSPDGDRLPLVYGVGYDLLHREVVGLSHRLLATIRLSDSAVQSTLTKRDPPHTVGEVRC